MPTSKRERQRENRARKREEQRKIERVRRIRRRAIRFGSIAGAVAVVLLVVSLIGGNSTDSTTTTSVPAITTTAATATSAPALDAVPQDYEGYRALPTACGAEPPPPVEQMTFDAPEDQGIPADAVVTATIATSCGDIVAQLDPAAAPETVNSFVFLARREFFDGSVFHRIMGDFMVQGGDPTATGRGGPGYLIGDEFPTADFAYVRGTLAMANAGAESTGSQFFIVTADDALLPPAYSVFGKTVDSEATLDAIASVPVTGRDGTTGSEQSLPTEAVYIESVTIDIAQ